MEYVRGEGVNVHKISIKQCSGCFFKDDDFCFWHKVVIEEGMRCKIAGLLVYLTDERETYPKR